MEEFKRLERTLIHSGSTIDYYVDTILMCLVDLFYFVLNWFLK